MLALIRRSIRRVADLPHEAWLAIGVEALIPTAAVLMLTGSPFIGPWRPRRPTPITPVILRSP